MHVSARFARLCPRSFEHLSCLCAFLVPSHCSHFLHLTLLAFQAAKENQKVAEQHTAALSQMEQAHREAGEGSAVIRWPLSHTYTLSVCLCPYSYGGLSVMLGASLSILSFAFALPCCLVVCISCHLVLVLLLTSWSCAARYHLWCCFLLSCALGCFCEVFASLSDA